MSELKEKIITCRPGIEEIHSCTREEFLQVKEELEKSQMKYSYSTVTNLLRFYYPTILHGMSGRWLTETVNKSALLRGSPFVLSHITLDNFRGRFQGSSITVDGAIFIRGRIGPTIALEVGYTKSYENLLRDAELLLEGTEGRIGVVILIFIQPPKLNEGDIQADFVEVHVFDEETQKRCQVGDRAIIFPSPSAQTLEEVSLSREKLFREQLSDLDDPNEMVLTLKFENLRAYMAEGIARHRAGKSDNEEPAI